MTTFKLDKSQSSTNFIKWATFSIEKRDPFSLEKSAKRAKRAKSAKRNKKNWETKTFTRRISSSRNTTCSLSRLLISVLLMI